MSDLQYVGKSVVALRVCRSEVSFKIKQSSKLEMLFPLSLHVVPLKVCCASPVPWEWGVCAGEDNAAAAGRCG